MSVKTVRCCDTCETPIEANAYYCVKVCVGGDEWRGFDVCHSCADSTIPLSKHVNRALPGLAGKARTLNDG